MVIYVSLHKAILNMNFDLKGLNQPREEIIPPNRTAVSIDDAIEESEAVVDELSNDSSNIGRTAAEHYLLRYEYGMTTRDLANQYSVPPRKITNTVSEVRSKVLNHPTHARNISNLRARRADLSEPELNDGRLTEGYAKLEDDSVQYHVEFKSGNAGNTYDWCYSSEVRFEEDAKIHHLFADYLIDAEHGVLIKRTMRAMSLKSWEQPPLGEDYSYKIYPLPNLQVPNSRDGSLLDAVEYHLTHDIKNNFGLIVNEERPEGDLDNRVKRDFEPLEGSAYFCRDDVLAHRIRTCSDSSEAVQDHEETNHIRKNLERVMRIYPFISPFDLPSETVVRIWNGSHGANRLIDKRSIYDFTTRVSSRFEGRAIRHTGVK